LHIFHGQFSGVVTMQNPSGTTAQKVNPFAFIWPLLLKIMLSRTPSATKAIFARRICITNKLFADKIIQPASFIPASLLPVPVAQWKCTAQISRGMKYNSHAGGKRAAGS
jgi:hypothetical protein